ncbi:hypothetical protein E2C01_012322 [Portunus trituberculatus]|uniref:Uncharacterized protein n=1 Tax=Portunus trituberculatus TaxID=210409 RepID=A0A5B7DDM5_PORTR|nr:hypothetical protein [Portunus trituberculatus]
MHHDHHHHHHHQQQQQQYEEEQHPRLRSPFHAHSDESSLPPTSPHTHDSPTAPGPHHPNAHGHQRHGRDRGAPRSHYPRDCDFSDEICFRNLQKKRKIFKSHNPFLIHCTSCIAPERLRLGSLKS